MKDKILNKFNIIPRKKISIPDIKQYLVDEFNNTNQLQKQVYKLQDDLKKCAETEVKYQATLLTLDEYKNRVKEKEERIKKLDTDIKELQEELEEEKKLKNDKIIEYKKLNSMYDKLNSKFEKELKNSIKLAIEEKIKIIQNLKGSISKQKIIDVLAKIKQNGE